MMNHYEYIDEYAGEFSKALGLSSSLAELSSSSGDKCYGYFSSWEKAGINRGRGAMLYLLSYEKPYSETVRDTESGWVNIREWVIDMHNKPEIQAAFEFAGAHNEI